MLLDSFRQPYRAEELEIIDGTAAAATDEVQYIYGWERDLRRAWRIRVGDPAKEKELSDEPRYLKGACDWEPIFADFPDGPYEINDVTVAEWKEMKKGRGSRPKHDAPLWEMRHVTSNNELTINQRTDRKLLLSLYEQSKQILQLTMENWGPLPGVQPAVVDRSDPTLKAALAFLTPIAEAYGRNEIHDVPLLKKIRNTKMKELGIKMRGPAQGEHGAEDDAEEGDEEDAEAGDEEDACSREFDYSYPWSDYSDHCLGSGFSS